MNKAQLKSFARGSLVSMFGIGTLGIMNYFIRRTLALNLTELEYGFIYSAFALIMPVVIFLDLGLTQSVTILLAKSFAKDDNREAARIFTHAFYIKICLAVAVFIVLELASPYITKHYMKFSGGNLPLMLILTLIITKCLEGAFFCVVAAKKAFSTQQLLGNISAFTILVSVLFGSHKYGLNFCIMAFIAASVIVACLAAPIIIKKYGVVILSPSNLETATAKKIFSISIWIAVSTAGISLMYYMDTACLTWLKGLESVSLYNIALPIMQVAQGFFVFPGIFIPFVAEMWQKNDYCGIRRSCIFGDLIMLATLPAFMIVGHYFSPVIVKILFDAKYVDAAPAVTILWGGMVFFSIASFNINALNSGGKQKLSAIIVASCVVINFILNIVLISRSDFIGAAEATAVTYLIMAVISAALLIIHLNKKIKQESQYINA